jgi:hypothetical protein
MIITLVLRSVDSIDRRGGNGCVDMGRLSLCQGEGRVRVIQQSWRYGLRTPHLSPLPFPRGEAPKAAGSATRIQSSLRF